MIVVDWEYLAQASLPHYYFSYAAPNTYPVGVVVASYLNLLYNHGISPAQIQIIGFSLGAHVAGVAGRTSHTQWGKIVGRITGFYSFMIA